MYFIKIYNDIYGEKILTKEEYTMIYNSMKQGIKYFNKDYNGDNPVEYIVNNNLKLSVLVSSIYKWNINILVHKHLNYQDINKIYFYNYNTHDSYNKIMTSKGVFYIILVKK